MSSLRDRLLNFLRDDYCSHGDHPLQSQLGDFKYEGHRQAFRVQLKQLLYDGTTEEAQQLLVAHGHLAPQPALAEAALRKAAETALTSTPDGTAPRRRGNLCERVMECALDTVMEKRALGSAEEREGRLQWAREDYRKQSGPEWPPFSLEGAAYQAVIERLVGAEAEAWLYDAGYPAAALRRRQQQLLQQDDWEAAMKEPPSGRANDENIKTATSVADEASTTITAPRRPRLKDIPLGLVERYQRVAYTNPAAEDQARPTPTTLAYQANSTPAAADGDLQASIVQLWQAMAREPGGYSDVLVPLLLDDRSGAGLYLMGPDLLQGNGYALEAWCSRATREKMRALPRPAFFFVILRRSPDPDLNLLGLPLLRRQPNGADTRLENMNAEVLAPERTVALAAANALAIFQDECATNPRFNQNLDFYRKTNLFVPPDCPVRFRALFGEDDF